MICVLQIYLTSMIVLLFVNKIFHVIFTNIIAGSIKNTSYFQNQQCQIILWIEFKIHRSTIYGPPWPLKRVINEKNSIKSLKSTYNLYNHLIRSDFCRVTNCKTYKVDRLLFSWCFWHESIKFTYVYWESFNEIVGSRKHVMRFYFDETLSLSFINMH